MNNAELGKRLKAARLAKKMTQSDVVGSYITRNMLSQIESGNASPSMKTLEYLAGVLEVPMERLLAEQPESLHSDAADVLRNVKTLLQEHQYDAVLEACDTSGLFEDEFHALHAIAHLAIAEASMQSQLPEQLQNAVLHAREAAKEFSMGIYANETRQASANKLIAEAALLLSSYYSTLANDGI